MDRINYSGALNEHACTFCYRECDIGISDEETWLPAEATSGFCEPCCVSTNTFDDLWKQTVECGKVQKDVAPARLDELMKMTNESPLAEFNNENANKNPRYGTSELLTCVMISV